MKLGQLIAQLEDLRDSRPFVDDDTEVLVAMDGSPTGEYTFSRVEVQTWLDSAEIILGEN